MISSSSASGIGKTSGLKSPMVRLYIFSPAAILAFTSPASLIISDARISLIAKVKN